MATQNLDETSGKITNEKNITNNSGQGKESVVLDIVSKKFNWGAFYFTWIWGLCNKSYITLIALPLSFNFNHSLGTIIYAGVCIWFGIEGNKWAWQNKEWDSIEEFHTVQKNWAIGASIAILLTCIALVSFFMILYMFSNKFSKDPYKEPIKKELIDIMDSITLMKANRHKCNLTSKGLINCFSEYIVVKDKSDNTIKVLDGASWTFRGDGSCKNKGECTITIKTTKEEIEPAVIPIYALPNGYLRINPSDVEEYLNVNNKFTIGSFLKILRNILFF